jgi:hypothetical protein
MDLVEALKIALFMTIFSALWGFIQGFVGAAWHDYKKWQRNREIRRMVMNDWDEWADVMESLAKDD